MPSNINPYNINGNYPVAGQDNDSQGFRDNFTNIRNNLAYTKSELEDLQAKVVLKTALSGTTLTNELNGSRLGGAQLINTTEVISDKGAVGGSIVLSYPEGNVQRLSTTGSLLINLSNWPASGIAGKLRIIVNILNVAHTLSLPSTVTLNIDQISGARRDPSSGRYIITFQKEGTYIFDLVSVDGGATYAIIDLSRNRAAFDDKDLYKNRNAVTTGINALLVNYDNALSVGVAKELGHNAISARGGIESYQYVANVGSSIWGSNISLSNHAHLSVGSSRTGTAIKDNDTVGYFNAVAYTNPHTDFSTTGNTNISIGGLEWVAKGGNISVGSQLNVWTKANAGNVALAMYVDNSQVVYTTGNLNVGGTAGVTGNLYVGQNVDPSTFTAPVILAKNSGTTFIQMSAQNINGNGSADIIAYANNSTDTSGFADVGFTGNTFNDSNYTITYPNDGYLFVEGTASKGGNLVIATGATGPSNDIIFATGGFLLANEKMRYIHSTGQLDIQPTTAATSTSTGALRVRGGAGIAGNIVVGGATIHQGPVLDSYQYQTPTNGASLTLSAIYSTVVLEPASSLTSLTVTMPTGVYDGQRLTISGATNGITGITHNAGAGQTLKGGLTALTANTGATWMYRVANTTWYRLA